MVATTEGVQSPEDAKTPMTVPYAVTASLDMSSILTDLDPLVNACVSETVQWNLSSVSDVLLGNLSWCH